MTKINGKEAGVTSFIKMSNNQKGSFTTFKAGSMVKVLPLNQMAWV